MAASLPPANWHGTSEMLTLVDGDERLSSSRTGLTQV